MYAFLLGYYTRTPTFVVQVGTALRISFVLTSGWEFAGPYPLVGYTEQKGVGLLLLSPNWPGFFCATPVVSMGSTGL